MISKIYNKYMKLLAIKNDKFFIGNIININNIAYVVIKIKTINNIAYEIIVITKEEHIKKSRIVNFNYITLEEAEETLKLLGFKLVYIGE